MKIRLLRNARVLIKAGDIVDTTPEVAAFLVSVKSAVVVAAPPADKKKKAVKK